MKFFEDFLIFKYNEKEYKFTLNNIIDYINNYYTPDDIITDINGLFQEIEDYARARDLIELIFIFNNIDEYITDYEYIIIYNSLRIEGFNTLDELIHIYNISEIIDDLIFNKQLKYYCIEV